MRYGVQKNFSCSYLPLESMYCEAKTFTTPPPLVFIQPFKPQSLLRSLSRKRLYTSTDKQRADIKM
jgi:hypothetical protein